MYSYFNKCICAKMVNSKVDTKNSIEKSPSPQPFREPDDMVRVNLVNGDYKRLGADADGYPVKVEKVKVKKVQTICVLLYIILVVIVTVLSYNAILYIKKGSITFRQNSPKIYVTFHNLNPENAVFKYNVLKSKYNFGEEQIFSKCKICKTWMACCGLLFNTDIAHIIQQCTVKDMLDIYSDHKLGNNLRQKRDIYEDYIENYLLAGNNIDAFSVKLQPPYVESTYDYFIDYDEYGTEQRHPEFYDSNQNGNERDHLPFHNNRRKHFLQNNKQGIEIKNIANIKHSYSQKNRHLRGKQNTSNSSTKSNNLNMSNRIYTSRRYSNLVDTQKKTAASMDIFKDPQHRQIISRSNSKHLETATNATSIPKHSYNILSPYETRQIKNKVGKGYTKEMIHKPTEIKENVMRISDFSNNPVISKDSIMKNDVSNISTTLYENKTVNSDGYKQNTKSSRSTNTSIRTSNVNSDLRSKSKTDSFSVANEDVQINQQTLLNPCFYNAPTGYRLGSSFDGPQMVKILPINTPKIPQYVLNPPMYPYMQPTFMQAPYYFPNYGFSVQQFHQEQHGYSTPLHVTSPGGQYYVCNPISPPTNNIASIPGIEIRREALNLQDIMQTTSNLLNTSNQTREAINDCPSGQHSCRDGSRCVSNQHVCDNEVHCDDGSDEMYCSCKDRVGKMRSCDGYPDCPNSEDEQGCFGCEENEFSCDDWSKSRRSTCIPIEQRCDTVKQCELTGKDEEDCAILTDYIGSQPQFKISNTVGFLHRNYKGKWYPMCLGANIWAEEVCKIESGPSIINPRLHMMLVTNDYHDDFIDIFPNNQVHLVKGCVQDRAAFVECPPLYCGLRMMIKNAYRPHEIDTSIEDVINELQRISDKPSVTKTLNNNRLKEDISNPSLSRVVGGNPSQPAAWPWLVSIYKNGIFHCGGVLINDIWVVTAAHCVDRYWQYYYDIQAGMLRRFSYSPMEQRRWAALIKPHENYDRNSLRNDIALIKLSSPVRYNRYVRPICLPSEATAGRDFLRGPPPGAICTTAGWGATVEHGTDPDHMREVDIPVLENCKNQDDQVGDEICAGLSEGGKDACQGDSGGPFMCRNPNNPSQWYLAGIVSHGEGCARPGEPGVYTKVSKFVGWIVEVISSKKNVHRVPLLKCPGYICKGIQICLPVRRRCDKIVDCLLGDDERGCKSHSQNIFKHSSRTYLVGLPSKTEDKDSGSIIPSILDDIFPSIVFNENKSSTGINTHNSSKMSITQNQDGNTVDNLRYFKCERMLQIIPESKRCNKIFDCEDGTDEKDCLCSDYVKYQNTKSICDGVTDCYDLSDEIDCGNCKASEYYCRRSKECIDISKRCNDVKDCSTNEDEWDCAALTDSVTLTLDSDLRPKLGMSGIITINRFGVWRPLCVNTSDNEASIATNVCNLLGFEEYIEYHKYLAKDKPLNVTIEGFKQANYNNESSNMCSGLYVRCSNVSLDSSVYNVYQDNITDDVELYTLPWNAVIYSDGIYRCMGTILNSRWIVTSVNCFGGMITLDVNYVTVLLGAGKLHLVVNGPYEQILRVTESVVINGSDIALLYLEQNITFNRYIRPSNINARKKSFWKEPCVALGLEGGKVKYVLLRSITICPIGFRCFESNASRKCESFAPWSGAIVCNSDNGWYPSAIYDEKNGRCGFSFTKQFTNIQSFKSKILEAVNTKKVNRHKHKPDLPYCDGYRCRLGECIEENKICNEIPDCRSGEDEYSDICYKKKKDCHLTDKCACPLSHLKCNNNKCIPKSSFCNRINDCGDYGDEPDICSCREYLLLTNATKICDGIIHCMDRTDEDPKLCTCKSGNVKCGNTPFCTSYDMVCDGFTDCPNGEDESECIALKAEDVKGSSAGEVIKRTGGIWHSGCFKLNYTTTELEEICYSVGQPIGNATQLTPRSSLDVTTLRPKIDDFSVIWIHRIPGNKLQLRVRTGFEPYVRFLPDSNCYKLFIDCL